MGIGHRTVRVDGGEHMTDLDRYLQCLANRRRRFLLYHLGAREVTTVERLASTLVTEFDGPAPGDLLGPEEVAAELRHNHLPKLDDLSVVDYDARSGQVTVLESPRELEVLLDATERFDRPR